MFVHCRKMRDRSVPNSHGRLGMIVQREASALSPLHIPDRAALSWKSGHLQACGLSVSKNTPGVPRHREAAGRFPCCSGGLRFPSGRPEGGRDTGHRDVGGTHATARRSRRGAVTGLFVMLFSAGEAESSAPRVGRGGPAEVYLVEAGPEDVELLAEAGVDTTHLPPDRGRSGRGGRLLDPGEGAAPAGPLGQVKRIDGVKASTVAAQRLAAGQVVFRTYGGPGGIAEELRRSPPSTRA